MITSLFLRALLLMAAIPAVAIPVAAFADDPPFDPLIADALNRELSGDIAARDSLLQQAQAKSPDLAKARWQTGQIRVGKRWMNVDDAIGAKANQPKFARYRQLRNAVSSPMDHARLAFWCIQQEMPDRERWHWMHVLRAFPNHRDALRRMDLKRYQGMLLSDDEIKQWEVVTAKLEHWSATVDKWKETLALSNDAATLQEIRDTADIYAIPVLESRISQLSEAAGTAVVEAVSELSEPHAARSLVNHAVLSSFESVRQLATSKLQDRDMYLYVPILVGSLFKEMEATAKIDPFLASYQIEFYQEGPTGSRQMRVVTRLAELSGRRAWRIWQNMPSDNSRRILSNVARTNSLGLARNERIIYVLRQTTGIKDDLEPEEWWDWWTDHNELTFPKVRFKALLLQDVRIGASMSHSCFGPGTKVWTDTGPVNIEDIRPGDRVLSQSPQSGELAFKLVVRITTGSPSDTIRMRIAGEEIVATRGHNFWSIGNGWRMTKHLEAGQRLRTVNGPIEIEQLERGPESNIHNLIVADFGTYFVGKAKVLTHDITMPRYTDNVVPGYKP